MAKKVTNEDIIQMNEAFLLCKTYSGVAKATGWSASTVKKYIIDGYISSKKPIEYNVIPLSVEDTIQKLISNEAICSVTEEEKLELKELQKDIIV